MKYSSRFYILLVWIFISLIIIVTGTWLERYIVKDGHLLSSNLFGSPAFLFFSAVNINVILLLIFVFLTFRSGVKLIVDSSQGIFGSKLNTKLVTSFLFFSLLPTVVLLYVSTKFVNTNFEKWLPSSFLSTAETTLNSEASYQEHIKVLLYNQSFSKKNMALYDFVEEKQSKKMIHLSEVAKPFEKTIASAIEKSREQLEDTPHWFAFGNERMILIRNNSQFNYGILSPKMLHSQWLLLKSEYPDSQVVANILKLSYYVILGVITLLIIFSATWLGFTIAREITIPLKILADATESVAHGNYSVKIDDIVSDDEIGKLALSFRSMVSDLKTERERVELFAAKLKKNAEELSIKSEYNEVLLRNVNAAVIVLDSNLYIESWNHQAEILFKFTENEVIGKNISQVFESTVFMNTILIELKGISEHGKKRVEFDWSNKIGEIESHLQIAISMILSPRGKVGKILFINDLTELAKAQRLAAWRDVAKRIAHEIKNPLTPIKLGVQRLDKKFANKFSSTDREIFNEYIQIILQSTESIRVLVNEFIKFARMPHSLLREGNIVEAVYFAFRRFAGYTGNIKLKLELDINSEFNSIENEDRLNALPTVFCKFDREQVIRLIVNLISNAVGASEQNDSEVIVKIIYKDKDKFVTILVQDQGIGLSAEVKSRIFEPYFSTKKTGMGLGLTIIKQIIDEHAAQILVEENHPKGTIFIVKFSI